MKETLSVFDTNKTDIPSHLEYQFTQNNTHHQTHDCNSAIYPQLYYSFSTGWAYTKEC